MGREYDLLITGATVVTGTGELSATVAVRDGRVAALLAPDESAAAKERVDASGLHLLPGIIDTHVHLRDPGSLEREDFITGTRAAAAGGITTILEMATSRPPVNSAEILTRRAEHLESRALVDFGLYGAAGHDNMDQVRPLVEAGAVGIKTFMHGPLRFREAEYVGMCCVDEGMLAELMAEVAATGARHVLHAENDAMLTHLERRCIEAGRVTGIAHAESRPPVAEDVAVATALAIADTVGARVQIAHMSSPAAAQFIKEAKSRGVQVTAETCPQYLFLTDDALRVHGPDAKCNPALRDAETVERFWAYVADGTIDVVGSDHAPFTAEEKARGRDNIFLAPAGMPGLESMLPLMLDAVNRGHLTLPAVVRLMSERAAEIFQLPGKGRIAPGADADFVLVDLDEPWTFDMSRCFTKAAERMGVYHGRSLQGRVRSTFVRGVRVYHDGEITAEPGHGRFIRPARAACGD